MHHSHRQRREDRLGGAAHLIDPRLRHGASWPPGDVGGLVHHRVADDRAVRHRGGHGLFDRRRIVGLHLGLPLGHVEHAVAEIQVV